MAGQEMTVYLVIFDRRAYQIGETLFADIAAYIDDRYVQAHTDAPAGQSRRAALSGAWREDTLSAVFSEPQGSEPGHGALLLPSCPDTAAEKEAERAGKRPLPLFGRGKQKQRGAQTQQALGKSAEAPPPMPAAAQATAPSMAAAGHSLSEALAQLDESFSEMLLRKIDEAGITDAQCYKKANIDRKLFSKIRSDKRYRPSKPTALAFAIALELPLAETREMLEKAGFALSHSSKFDIIVEYFILHGNYNVLEINEALFAFDQNLLGA